MRQLMLFNPDNVMIQDETPDVNTPPEVIDLFQTPIRYLLSPNLKLSGELSSTFEERAGVVFATIQQRVDMTGGSLQLTLQSQKVTSQTPYAFVLLGWVTIDPFGNRTVVSFDPRSIQMDCPLPDALFDRAGHADMRRFDRFSGPVY